MGVVVIFVNASGIGRVAGGGTLRGVTPEGTVARSAAGSDVDEGRCDGRVSGARRPDSVPGRMRRGTSTTGVGVSGCGAGGSLFFFGAASSSSSSSSSIADSAAKADFAMRMRGSPRGGVGAAEARTLGKATGGMGPAATPATRSARRWKRGESGCR